MLIDQKGAYWPKMYILKNEKLQLFVFLNVYVAVIYVAMGCSEEQSTKSQAFQLLIYIYIYIV